MSADETVLRWIVFIAARADSRFGPMTSTHEGLGVLEEELLELKESIRANSAEGCFQEAADLAAVALRLARSCYEPAQAFAQRSGFKSGPSSAQEDLAEKAAASAGLIDTICGVDTKGP